MFINDLALQTKSYNIGVPVADERVSILLYADALCCWQKRNQTYSIYLMYYILGVCQTLCM